MRDIRKLRHHLPDHLNYRRIMQRRKHHRLLQVLHDRFVNPHMLLQLRPRMHHAISHRLRLWQPCPSHRIHYQPNSLHRRLRFYLAP